MAPDKSAGLYPQHRVIEENHGAMVTIPKDTISTQYCRCGSSGTIGERFSVYVENPTAVVLISLNDKDKGTLEKEIEGKGLQRFDILVPPYLDTRHEIQGRQMTIVNKHPELVSPAFFARYDTQEGSIYAPSVEGMDALVELSFSILRDIPNFSKDIDMWQRFQDSIILRGTNWKRLSDYPVTQLALIRDIVAGMIGPLLDKKCVLSGVFEGESRDRAEFLLQFVKDIGGPYFTLNFDRSPPAGPPINPVAF